VLHPDLYDPLLSRGYAELAQHFGCLIDPARSAKPKDKACASNCSSWMGWTAKALCYESRRARTKPAALRRA
jgi:hypothetical protein